MLDGLEDDFLTKVNDAILEIWQTERLL